MPVPAIAVAGLFGLIVGSFLNVVAHRLPRGTSLVKPRSACPECGTPVRPYDNVPVLSWLLLRGRCRDCDTRIDARYPLVEAGTASAKNLSWFECKRDPAVDSDPESGCS